MPGSFAAWTPLRPGRSPARASTTTHSGSKHKPARPLPPKRLPSRSWRLLPPHAMAAVSLRFRRHRLACLVLPALCHAGVSPSFHHLRFVVRAFDHVGSVALPPCFPRCRLQLLFIRNIPIMIGGLGMGFAGGVLLWFFNSPSTFALFLARRVGIDPAMVTRAAASANAADEK